MVPLTQPATSAKKNYLRGARKSWLSSSGAKGNLWRESDGSEPLNLASQYLVGHFAERTACHKPRI
jgi:hypothetical protein